MACLMATVPVSNPSDTMLRSDDARNRCTRGPECEAISIISVIPMWHLSTNLKNILQPARLLSSPGVSYKQQLKEAYGCLLFPSVETQFSLQMGKILLIISYMFLLLLAMKAKCENVTFHSIICSLSFSTLQP